MFKKHRYPDEYAKRERKEPTPGQIKSRKNLRPPWKKGQPGNPLGKRSMYKSWKVTIKEEFKSGKITQEKIVQKLIGMALKGDIKAMDIIFNRCDGAPHQSVDMDVTGTLADMLRGGYARRKQSLEENKDIDE